MKCDIPCWDKYDFSFKNSPPPLSEYKEIIGKLKNFSTTFLKVGNIIETSDLFFNGYNQMYLEKLSTKIK